MWRNRLGAIFIVLATIILVRLGQEAYRWYAYGDEREQIREMTGRLEEAGYRVIRTQMEADSLRHAIEAADTGLAVYRSRVDAWEQRAERGTLPPALYGSYREDLELFNRRIAERNATLAAWEDVIGQNHEVVARYNRLADSIRNVAAAMGEPYYDVPGPVEMAARRGLVPHQ